MTDKMIREEKFVADGDGVYRLLHVPNLFRDMGDGTFASVVLAHPPYDLLTDADGTGPNRRLRVDVGQTGFFAGREARTFYEFPSITAASTLVIRAVTPVNTVLWDLSVMLRSGEAKVYTVVGGAAGGTFSTTLPIIGTNTMSSIPQPPYSHQMVITAGGTHSGGTVIDELWISAGTNPALSSTSRAGADTERGVPAGTYYFLITAIADAVGLVTARWEERPEGV